MVQDRGLRPLHLAHRAFAHAEHATVARSWFGPTARSRSVWTQCCVHSWRCRVYFRSLTGSRLKS